VPFWERSQNGISRGMQQCRKPFALGVPRTSRAAEVRMECVSNVIYQKMYLIRLFFVSGI